MPLAIVAIWGLLSSAGRCRYPAVDAIDWPLPLTWSGHQLAAAVNLVSAMEWSSPSSGHCHHVIIAIM